LPEYELVKTEGKDHNAVFYVKCSIREYSLSVEENAKSIKRAEQSCAESILKGILNK
jgi:ribonuclease-3